MNRTGQHAENGGASSDQATGGLPHELLDARSVVLLGQATTRDEAISEAGQLLVKAKAVAPEYVDAMHERERSVSTHMGNLLAIPHGTNDAKSKIRRTALSFVRYPSPIDWDGRPTEFVIGIAGTGDDHLTLLTRIAEIFTDPQEVQRLRAAVSPAQAQAVLIGDE